MRGEDWQPTPPEIEHAPEVALLAVLDRTLDVAAAAIVAAHPNLLDDEPFYRHLDRPEMKAADAILTCARRLRDALACYRRAIAALRARESDPTGDPGAIPF